MSLSSVVAKSAGRRSEERQRICNDRGRTETSTARKAELPQGQIQARLPAFERLKQRAHATAGGDGISTALALAVERPNVAIECVETSGLPLSVSVIEDQSQGFIHGVTSDVEAQDIVEQRLEWCVRLEPCHVPRC